MKSKSLLVLFTLLLSFASQAQYLFGSSIYKPYNSYYTGLMPQQSDFCYECHFGVSQVAMPQIDPYWLNSYGTYRYQNWSYPGAWNSTYNSLNATIYPNTSSYKRNGSHHAGGGLGKPYMYVSGPKGEQINISVSFVGGKHWVSSPPVLHGWNVTIKGQNQLLVEGEEYAHLFYDYQIEENLLQFDAGFCGDRKFILKEMLSILAFSKFNKKEIRDFNEYWSKKIPKANGYCVYPQDDRVLSKGAKISFNGMSPNFIRVNFLIRMDPSKDLFPKSIWKPKYSLTESPFFVREWGVGFLLR